MSKSIGHEFMVKTRYENLEPSTQAKHMPQPPLEALYDQARVIDLPMPEDIPAITIDFMAAVELRTSVRDYQHMPVSLLELSFLLWCTQGVKQVLGGNKATLRTVPSAGARHAFETYLLINRVEGIKPGLYRFLALEHKLMEVNLEDNIAEEITKACLGQNFVTNSAVTFIWAADAPRMTWRYGERGYRYLHLDAGHICQNLYLSAQVIGCGACAIAAFDDEYINRTLGIDGDQQFVVYVATVGKR
ncbi:MAG: SagB/ThcOx family dehydrogenase [Sporomusaceae bacterium]|nr:SagB/ThcOx family dehydrogenase [Sporomusaceae bacterium]